MVAVAVRHRLGEAAEAAAAAAEGLHYLKVGEGEEEEEEGHQRWAQDEMEEEAPWGVQLRDAKEVLEVLAVPMDAKEARAEVGAPQKDATVVQGVVVQEGLAVLPLPAVRGWAVHGKVAEEAALESKYSPSAYALAWALAAGEVSSSLRQQRLVPAGRA